MSRGSSGTVVDVRVLIDMELKKMKDQLQLKELKLKQVQQDKIVEEEILERSIKAKSKSNSYLVHL